MFLFYKFYIIVCVIDENLMKFQYKVGWAWTLWCYPKKWPMKCNNDKKTLGIFASTNGSNDLCIYGFLTFNSICLQTIL